MDYYSTVGAVSQATQYFTDFFQHTEFYHHS